MFFVIITSYLIADFITGFVHWLEDTYGLPEWPFLGHEVIVPNIEHHRTPNAIGSMGTFLWRNYQSFALAALALLVAWLLGCLSWLVVLVAIFASLGNEVHACNHRARNNWLVTFLQETTLVQSPQQHAKHHKPPYDRNYCTLSNWVNPVLERLKFWRCLEWVVSLTGCHPKRMTAARQGY